MSLPDNLKILALIPARGGSKSVPRKNLLSMLGRPLLAWSIQHAQDSKYINRVIVSTDDDEIAKTASQCGAEVPFMRPRNISGDQSLDIEAFKHALTWLKINEEYEPDLVVHLRPTGPARRVEKIDEAIELIHANPEADSLRSVSLADQTPFKMWFMNDYGYMNPVVTLDGIKDSHSIARQMLPKAYWQNGYVDIVRSTTILDKGSMVGDKPLPFIINEPVVDVDYFDDLPKVEAALKVILDKSVETPKNLSSTDRYPV